MGRQDRGPSLTMVDLFSGVGGMSLGAELAGFRSIAAVDVDSVLQSGYRRNFPASRVIQADVSGLEPSDWRELIGRIRPDLVVGGPPCQGFSRIGKKREDDPRNELVGHFFRQVRLLRPKAFLMENVEGLLDENGTQRLRQAMDGLAGSYVVLDPFLVDAASFGAATSRRRVVVVGYDPGEVDPVDKLSLAAEPRDAGSFPTVRDAISDLPTPAPATDDGSFDWTPYLPRPARLSAYARRLRRTPPPWLGWAPAVDRHADGYLTGLQSTTHGPIVIERYGNVAPGKVDAVTKSYRLTWTGLCPTLRAGTGSDKGAFQAVRPLHPTEPRVITVREAARLQGFPDWFVFHPTKWHSFRMIGNSVSPAMAYGLLTKLGARLRMPLAA